MSAKSVLQKMIQHKVIVDLNPDQTFRGTPKWMDLELRKNGEWHCDYQGFIDEKQLEEIRANYEITENQIDAGFLEGLREQGFNLEHDGPETEHS